MMYLSVKKVEPLDNYILKLKFENAEERKFDMKKYLEFGIFRDLKDLKLFETVKVKFDTIEWDNGADIDPEVLYKDSF